MSISDILRGKGRHVVKVLGSASVENAIRLMSEHGIGAVVVEDQWMRQVGMFAERDIVHAIAEHGAQALSFPVERCMNARVVTCGMRDRVDTVMAAMTMAKIRHVPVIDGGQLVGIVSLGDLVKSRLDEKALEANVLLDIARLHA
jgi:CBS domain-containing protein